MDKVVIFGSHKWAEAVYIYLKYDSQYEVAGFTVDQEYQKSDTLFELPVVPFHEVERFFPPGSYKMLLGMSFQRMNRFREERYVEAKRKGYGLISYVSSRSNTWPNLVVGENCIICQQVAIEPFVTIGNNVVISSNVVIGHHVAIKDHVFIAPGVTILGGVTIEPYCLLAANSTVKEGVRIGRDCLIGMGVSVQEDTKECQAYFAPAPELFPKPTTQLREWLSWPVR